MAEENAHGGRTGRCIHDDAGPHEAPMGRVYCSPECAACDHKEHPPGTLCLGLCAGRQRYADLPARVARIVTVDGVTYDGTEAPPAWKEPPPEGVP
jgi:hypothetical protein